MPCVIIRRKPDINNSTTAIFFFGFKNVIAPLIPYVTIPVGLWVFHNAWVAIFSYHLMMGLALLIDKSRRVELKAILRSRNYKLPLVMAFFGAAGGILMYLLWPYLHVPDGIGDYLRNIGLSPDSWPFFLVYFVLFNPIMEELFWRGYLGSLNRSLVVNDFMFAGYHALILTGKMGLVWLVVIMLMLLGGAWLWRQVNRLCGGLMCSIVSHTTADLSIMLVMFLLIY